MAAVSWSLMLATLWEPWHLLLLACTFLPATLRQILFTHQHHHRDLTTLTSWRAFRTAWFSTTWATLGPMFADGGRATVNPLVAQHAHGVVLDVGPGLGDRVDAFTTTTAGVQVSKIWGVEPNLALHGELRRKVRRAGLGGVYEVVGAGAEELGGLGLGIGVGSVDTVVTVQVLCSVPDFEGVVGDLYAYLKPGGVWILHQHVRTRERGWVAWYQAMINVIWPQVFGGCSLTREVDEVVKRAGDWDEVKLAPIKGQNAYTALPGVTGYLIKKKS